VTESEKFILEEIRAASKRFDDGLREVFDKIEGLRKVCAERGETCVRIRCDAEESVKRLDRLEKKGLNGSLSLKMKGAILGALVGGGIAAYKFIMDLIKG
jgi:hypothetical protein